MDYERRWLFIKILKASIFNMLSSRQIAPLIICGLVFVLVGVVVWLSSNQSLNSIKSKIVGDGQHGIARFASKNEIKRAYKQVEFEVDKWRKNLANTDQRIEKKDKPAQKKPLPQGVVVGVATSGFGGITALVENSDVHTLMIGAAGAGKTACFIYPNIEYALASGMSFVSTDTKGDIVRNFGSVAKDIYGYNIAVIDLRNPTRSDGFNLIYLVNKYMDIYAETGSLSDKAKAERYAKITAKTIVFSSGLNSLSVGQNAYFYDAAEGLLASTILLVSEFCEDGKRHIISVFKLIQDLISSSGESAGKGSIEKNQFKILLEKLPAEHKARWFAGAALNSSTQSMASVLSTVLSRLNAFLDSEMEQVLCFDTDIDAEKFAKTKSDFF